MMELEAYTCAEIAIAAPLTLVDLTGDGLLKMGVPTDVVGARDQTLAQIWSRRFTPTQRTSTASTICLG